MRWQAWRRVVIGTLATGVLVVAAAISTMPARAFPDDQLDRGEAVWKRACDRCHGETRPADSTAPVIEQYALIGAANAAGLYEVITNHPPESNPGPLTDQEYWDAMAYLLQQNQIGEDEKEPLTPDSADNFIIDTHAR